MIQNDFVLRGHHFPIHFPIFLNYDDFLRIFLESSKTKLPVKSHQISIWFIKFIDDIGLFDEIRILSSALPFKSGLKTTTRLNPASNTVISR